MAWEWQTQRRERTQKHRWSKGDYADAGWHGSRGWSYWSPQWKSQWRGQTSTNPENDEEWVTMTYADVVKNIRTQPHSPKSLAEETKGDTSRVDNKARLAALTTLLEQLPDNEHLKDYREQLVRDISFLKKKTTDSRSIATQIDSIEHWNSREEKRITTLKDKIVKLEEELEEARKNIEDRQKEVDANKDKVKTLKEDLIKADAAADETHKEEVEKNAKDAKDTKVIKLDAAEAALLKTELSLRRKITRKRDEGGKPLPDSKIQELQVQADEITEQLEKCRRVMAGGDDGDADMHR